MNLRKSILALSVVAGIVAAPNDCICRSYS